MKWSTPETLYHADFLRIALPTLEWFRSRLDFEIVAEGVVVTPSWLTEQGIVQDYYVAFQKIVKFFLDANNKLYGTWRKLADDQKQPWAAAIVLNRQGEYISKLKAHFHKIASREADYESANILKDMIRWPVQKTDEFKQTLVKIDHEYEIAIAQHAQILVGTKRDAHLPDFAGEFLSRTALTVLEAIYSDDIGVFRAVFPFFSMHQFTRLRHYYTLRKL